jgi:hypothetical protein
MILRACRPALVILAGALPLLSGEGAAPGVSGAVTPLFDPASLSGWASMHDAQLAARGGCLCLDGGMGWARTEHRYRDFVLTLEWRALKEGYDSGIYFRAPLEGKPWPKGYQVNLYDKSVGSLVGFNDEGWATPPSVRPVGEWNRFELAVMGTRAALKINGILAWETGGIELRDGFIGIQAENHRFEFRALEVREPGYRDLLAGGLGKALEVKHGGPWALKEGVLESRKGAGGGWLGTLAGDWEDFVLKLDYQVPRNGNSGVFLRCPLEGNPAYKGIEIQIVDDDATQWKLEPYQRTGAIYAAVPPRRRATRAAGTWESMEVSARGSRVEVLINGIAVLDEDLNEHLEKVGAEAALKDRPRRGFIGLQNYGTGVKFRNLRVKRTSGAALERQARSPDRRLQRSGGSTSGMASRL